MVNDLPPLVPVAEQCPSLPGFSQIILGNPLFMGPVRLTAVLLITLIPAFASAQVLAEEADLVLDRVPLQLTGHGGNEPLTNYALRSSHGTEPVSYTHLTLPTSDLV